MFSKFKLQDVNLVANMRQELHQVKSWAAQVIWELNNYRAMAEQQIVNLQRNLTKAEHRIQELKSPFVLHNSKHPYMSLTYTGRFRRRKKIAEFIKEKLKTLPKEFVPVEVTIAIYGYYDFLFAIKCLIVSTFSIMIYRKCWKKHY